MISMDTARRLKKAGLAWQPALHDFFVIPDRDLDDMVFVISDVQVTIEQLQGVQVVSFQGASEWALDSLLKEEAVWLPREEQLRRTLEAMLIAAGRPELSMTSGLGGYTVKFRLHGRNYAARASSGAEAYAAGLLMALGATQG